MGAGLTVLIFVVFAAQAILAAAIAATGEVGSNWGEMRCKPLVMPFAGLFGHDAGENFQYCVKRIGESVVPSLLGDITTTMGGLTDVMMQIEKSVEAQRGASNEQRGETGGILGMIQDKITTVLLAIFGAVIHIKDMFGGAIGTFAVGRNMAMLIPDVITGTADSLTSVRNIFPVV